MSSSPPSSTFLLDGFHFEDGTDDSNNYSNKMTFSRRAARYLSQYQWYNPNNNSSTTTNHTKEGGPSLDAAWSHYEHVTLPRRFVNHPSNSKNLGGDNHNDFVRAPQSQRSIHKTELYPVIETPLEELVHFGVSIRMFFSTLLVFSGILGIAGILNVPLMMYFWGYASDDINSNNKDGVDYMGIGKMIRASALCDASEWVACDTCHAEEHVGEYPAYRLDVSDGIAMVRRNVCDFEGFLVPGVCSFVATLLVLGLTAMAIFGKQRQAEIVFDEQIQTASDYSIRISNPPPDALDPDEWRDFFNQYNTHDGVDSDTVIDGDDNDLYDSMGEDNAHSMDNNTSRKTQNKNTPARRTYSKEGGGVVLVTIAIDNALLLQALILRRKLLRALSKLLQRGTDMTSPSIVEDAVQDAVAVASSSTYYRFIPSKIQQMLQQDARYLWSDIQNLENDIRSLVQQKYHAVAVFVTFDTERSQRNALHALSTGKINIWRNELLHRQSSDNNNSRNSTFCGMENSNHHNLQKGGQLTIRESNRSSSLWDFREAVQEERTIQLAMSAASTESSCTRALLFRGERVLRVKEAVEPSDVRWVDLQASHRQRFELHLASAVGMTVFVMWSGYFIYCLAGNYPGYYAAMFITMTNTLVPIVCEFINDLESHPTEHGKQISLYVKMTLFRWFNSAIALSVVSTFIETISVEDGNEFLQQSLMYKVYPVIVAELFCNPIIEIMDAPGNFRKHFLAPRAGDQEEMNACFTGGRFWLAERYTNANRVLFVALFFSSILPEALFLGSMALLAQYYSGKFSLLRLCGPTPDIGFHLSRLSRNYFTPIVLVTHVVMNAYWWSGYPYDNICENGEENGGGYSYCNQNFYGAMVFPPLPRFQPDGAKWMTESQETLTSLYGWASVVVILVAFCAFLRNTIIPWIKSIYGSTYEPDGMDQGIDFSSVIHLEEVHGYIPQAKVKGFTFPFVACDISGIDEDLVGWKDKHQGYRPHNLVNDAKTITASKILLPVFSIVKQWKTCPGNRQQPQQQQQQQQQQHPQVETRIMASNGSRARRPSGFMIGTALAISLPFVAGKSPINEFCTSSGKILVLDVDNTLYRDNDILQLNAKGNFGRGIEQQIVQNIHAFCLQHLEMTKEEADQLHHQYGSTIEGLRHNPTQNGLVSMKHFYNTVYHGERMDYSALLKLHQPTSSGGLTTGYSHSANSQMSELRNLLEQIGSPTGSLDKPLRLYLASNSPSWHVRKVVQALGLMSVKWRGLATPDADITGPRAENSHSNDSNSYPTKVSPSVFYQGILGHQKRTKDTKAILIDDSKTNIRVLPTSQWNGIRVSQENSLAVALLQALGIINTYTAPSSESSTQKEDGGVPYEFSQVRYLQTKNVVDAAAIDRPVWHALATELRKSMILSESNLENTAGSEKTTSELQIVDVGAGLLSMLKLILEGSRNSANSVPLPSLLRLIIDKNDSTAKASPMFQTVRYFAYEPNRDLQAQCIKVLQDLGFERERNNDGDQDEFIFVSSLRNDEDYQVIVHLRLFDYNADDKDSSHPESATTMLRPCPHLIVGCCFADLMDPYQFVPSLIHRFLSETTSRQQEECLCYFPITFQGVTQFVPPQPFEVSPTGKNIPSDTVAFALYSQALEKMGHSLDPHRLVQAMEAFGATEVASASSDWDIHPILHPFLWQTMMYFFERTATPELLKKGWDAAGWLSRARRQQSPKILVSNRDLLFRMPRLGFAKIAHERATTVEAPRQETLTEEIEFTAPFEVSTKKKAERDLNPNQILIKSEVSLISSGTELKVFKGMFDDAALDVNIKGMEDERMAYPLSYGYSLVGRVEQCGSEVEDADKILGRLVFAFSPHSSYVVTERSAVQLVPHGIEAEDAIFMPSVETACSIIHDAHVRLGERVAVFGQGMIGLLVTAILCSTTSQRVDLTAPCCSNNIEQNLGTVTTFDAIPSRLSASAAMGASQALMPTEVVASGPFDVAIEVSGNSRALQAAIDNTRNHGRLIIGSWYGNADVSLKLGIEFHRSHKKIITSQVSEIRPELSGLWTKERRFALTWELVRQIRPSRLLTMKTTLANAQSAYEALDKGSEIAVAFHYNDR